MLVAALSQRWGWDLSHQGNGKIVWALVGRLPRWRWAAHTWRNDTPQTPRATIERFPCPGPPCGRRSVVAGGAVPDLGDLGQPRGGDWRAPPLAPAAPPRRPPPPPRPDPRRA